MIFFILIICCSIVAHQKSTNVWTGKLRRAYHRHKDLLNIGSCVTCEGHIMHATLYSVVVAHPARGVRPKSCTYYYISDIYCNPQRSPVISIW